MWLKMISTIVSLAHSKGKVAKTKPHRIVSLQQCKIKYLAKTLQLKRVILYNINITHLLASTFCGDTPQERTYIERCHLALANLWVSKTNVLVFDRNCVCLLMLHVYVCVPHWDSRTHVWFCCHLSVVVIG